MHITVAAPRRPRVEIIVEIGRKRSCDCDDTDGARAVEATLMFDVRQCHVPDESSV
jgi:hypothetical protein